MDKEGRSTLRQTTRMSAMQIRLSEAEKLSAMMPSKADVDLERILSAADIVNSVAIPGISRARALSFSVSEGDSKVTSDFLFSIGDCAFRCNLQRASPIKVKLNQSLGNWPSDF
mgnify:CR=1 FL=1|tara:strand:- start:99 stop:440 length:342 start_codon:yes stop_codon:yes gene_type:complete